MKKSLMFLAAVLISIMAVGCATMNTVNLYGLNSPSLATKKKL